MGRRLQARLADSARTLSSGCCATDSAFTVTNEMTGKMITPLEDGDLEKASPIIRAGLTVMSSAVASIRQAAEWEWDASKVYMQLLLTLPFDPDRRKCVSRISTICITFMFELQELFRLEVFTWHETEN